MLLQSNDFGFLTEGGDHALLGERRIILRHYQDAVNELKLDAAAKLDALLGSSTMTSRQLSGAGARCGNGCRSQRLRPDG